VAKEKFAIIGSGPSALVCAEELLKHYAEVTMIGPDKSDANSKFDIKNIKKFLAKDRFTKKNVYASFSRELQVNQFGTNFLETPIKGGLSEIWGGVCFPQHHSERKFLHIPETDYISIMDELIDYLKITNTTSDFWESFINRNIKSDSFFGAPSMAIENGKIWSASKGIQSLQLKGLEFIRGEVVKIENEINGVKITILNNNQYQTCFFDRIFIASGPVGDAKLILNSFPDLENISIADTATEFHFLLKFNLHNKLQKDMRPIISGIFLNGDKTLRTYVQVYPISAQLISSLPIRYVYNVFFPFFWLASKFIFLGMIFHPQAYSRNFIVTKINNGFESSVDEGELGQNEKWNNNQFKAFGYKTIFKSIKNKPGSGIHSGAFIPNDKFDYGRLTGLNINFPNAHFIGASSLSILPTGPITLTSLINSVYIVRRVMCDLLK